MSKLAIVLGIALIVLGVIAFIAGEEASVAALLPAVLGAITLMLGAAGMTNEEFRTRAVQGATLCVALTFLWTVESVRFVLYMISVGPQHVDDSARVLVRGLTAILCAIYLYFAIRSFVGAQKPDSPAN